MVFVFDREVALETLASEFFQNSRYVRNACAEGHVVSFTRHFVQVFEMTADDTPLQDADAIDGLET